MPTGLIHQHDRMSPGGDHERYLGQVQRHGFGIAKGQHQPCALALFPADRAVGHPHCGGALSRQVMPARAGPTRRYLRCNGALHDTVRDVFVAARLNERISAPWTTAKPAHACACRTVTEARHVEIEGTIVGYEKTSRQTNFK